jgi:hypothetical protein
MIAMTKIIFWVDLTYQKAIGRRIVLQLVKNLYERNYYPVDRQYCSSRTFSAGISMGRKVGAV